MFIEGKTRSKKEVWEAKLWRNHYKITRIKERYRISWIHIKNKLKSQKYFFEIKIKNL
jgi:hypothetical protein